MGRSDGIRLKKVDSMHTIMPIMYPNRCDNEAFISETVDITNINAFLEKKNAADPEYPYKLFQVMVTAMLKVLYLRPKMNRFIANRKLYQHNEVSAAFTVKKYFKDDSEESLAIINSKPEDTFESIHQEIQRQVMFCKDMSKKDASTQDMDVINKMPDFLIQLIGYGVRFLDRHGWMPKSMIATDPYQRSVVISNLGSVKLHAGYHHLTNWGTTSVFLVIGEIAKRQFIDAAGNVSIRDSVDLTLTVDERIADGYYYSQTMKLFLKLLQHPELLELPLAEEVEY